MPDSPWFKLALPLVAIVLLARGLPRLAPRIGGESGLGPPVWRRVLPWYAAYVAWMLATNALLDWRGPFDFTPWRTMPLLDAVVRVLAVGVAGPIAEEMFFRGLILGRLAQTRLGTSGAVVVSALLWAVIHVSYTPAVMAVLAVAGVLLALARLGGRSIWGAALMHVTWNLFAVW